MPRALLATLASILTLVAFAGSASAGFAPTNEAIVEAEQMSASLALEPDGDGLVVWHQKQTLTQPDREGKARRVSAGGEVGAVFDFAPGQPVFEPVAAMTATGRAFVAWRSSTGGEPSSVIGRWVEVDGTMGPLLTVAAAGASLDAGDLHVVVGSVGATVAWTNQAEGSELEMRRVGFDGALGSLVPDVSGGFVIGLEVVAMADGSTLAVWRGTGTEKNVLAADGAVGTPETISEVNSTANPQAAVDQLGNVLAVWREDSGEGSVRGRRLSSTGAPVGPEVIVDPDQAGFVGTQVRVSADSQDDFFVTWNRQDSEGDALVHGRAVDSGGGLGPTRTFSSDFADASAQQSALVDDGTGAILWNESGTPDDFTLGRTLGPLGAPTSGIDNVFGDGFGEIEVASAPATSVAMFLVSYPISGSAQGAVLRRFLTPPSCRDANGRVEQGRSVRIEIDCSGPAIEDVRVVERPKFGRVAAYEPLTGTFRYRPKTNRPRRNLKGQDRFTVVATNDGGESNIATVTVIIDKDTRKPRVTSFTVRRALLKRKSGLYVFRFHLEFSELARGSVRLKPLGQGKRCKLRERTRGGKGRFPGRARLSASAVIILQGKATNCRHRPKRFRAKASATDLAGNKSQPRYPKLRVKARPR